jgi:hypothetical protein
MPASSTAGDTAIVCTSTCLETPGAREATLGDAAVAVVEIRLGPPLVGGAGVGGLSADEPAQAVVGVQRDGVGEGGTVAVLLAAGVDRIGRRRLLRRSGKRPRLQPCDLVGILLEVERSQAFNTHCPIAASPPSNIVTALELAG